MKRHYFISEDLDELKVIEQELEQSGVITPQIHVLSEDDAGVKTHRLNAVEAVLRKNVVGGTERGALIGAIGAALILAAAWATGIAATISWVPPVFLAVIVLGFCTWEGGLIGIQEPHADFIRFRDSLKAGKHILAVDIGASQEHILHKITSEHPGLSPAGEGPAAPGWFVGLRGKFEQMMKGTAWRHQ
tara:strand:- start:9265 stop:9831 length:567 start_codon:yes stop_codon:yes gene_type:complete